MSDPQFHKPDFTYKPLRDAAGDDETFFLYILAMLLQDAGTSGEVLLEAAEAGDVYRAQRAAHALKGHALNIGSSRLAAHFAHVEAVAEAGDIGELRRSLPAGLDALAATRAEIDRFLLAETRRIASKTADRGTEETPDSSQPPG